MSSLAATTIGREHILGKLKITADTDLRLCRYFGLEPGFWLKLQITSDLEARTKLLSGALSKVPVADGAGIAHTPFYARLSHRRRDDILLRNCVDQVVKKLDSIRTSESRPGMLLGRIQ